jgi:Methyltransferase domain
MVRVVAVEPEPYLRGRAVQAAAAAPVPVRVADGTAAELPAADGEFDAVVISGPLCSVSDVPPRSPSSPGSYGQVASCAVMSMYAARTPCSPGSSKPQA